MAENTGDAIVGTEAGDTPPGEQEKKDVQAQLQAANVQAAEATLLARMAQDPEFGEIMRARAAGKKVKIIPDDNEYRSRSVVDEVAPEPQAEIDLEKMTNKELLQHLLRENVKATEKVLQAKLAPVLEQVTKLQTSSDKQLQTAAAGEFQVLQRSYPDVTKPAVVNAMVKLNAENPALNAKQLYVLAKAGLGEPVVEARHVSTERPGSVTTRPPARKLKPVTTPGMLGLREVIRQAAANLPGSGILDAGLDEQEVEAGD